MAGIKLPGQAGMIAARKAAMSAAVVHSWNVATAPPAKPQAMPLWKQPDEPRAPTRANAHPSKLRGI